MLILTQVLSNGWLWFWKYKFECLSFLLSLGIVGLVLVADHYEGKRDEVAQEFKAYKIDQAKKALIAETEWRTQVRVAEERFSEKVKALERANITLSANADRMSVALGSAKVKYAQASADARAEYTDALNTVSGQCIARYRWLAKVADGHANDAEVARQLSMPIKEPP